MADMSSSDGHGVLSGNPHSSPVSGGSSLCDSSLLASSASLGNMAQSGQVPNGGAGASPLGWGAPDGMAPGYPGGMPFAPQGPPAMAADGASQSGTFMNSSFHHASQSPGQAGSGGLVGDTHPGPGGPPLTAQMTQNPHLPSPLPMHSAPVQSSAHPNMSPPSVNLSTAAVGSAAFAQQLAAFSSSVGSGNVSHSQPPPLSSSQFLLSQYRPLSGPAPFDPSASLNARGTGPLQPATAPGASPVFPVVPVPQGAMPMHPQMGTPGPNGALGPVPAGPMPLAVAPGVGSVPGPGGATPGGAGTPHMGMAPGGPGVGQTMQQKVFGAMPCAVPAVSLRQIEISAAPRMCPGTGLWGDERKRRASRKCRDPRSKSASAGAESAEKREEDEAQKGDRGEDSGEDEDDRTGGHIVLKWIEQEGLAGLHRLLVDALLMPAPKTTNGSRLVSLAARAAQLPPVPGVVYDPHQYQFLARYLETEDSTVPITKRFPLRRWGFFKSYRFACDVVQQAAKPGVFEDGEIVPVKEPLPGLDGQGLTGTESPPVEYYVLPDCPEVSLPVIKGVSRDKKSRRWAVYYRNQRRYFYDKKEEKLCKEKKEDEAPSLSPHAGVKEAYEMAVQLRRQQVQEVELLQMFEESNSGASQGDDMTLLLPCYQAVLLTLLHNLEKNIRSGGIDCVLALVVPGEDSALRGCAGLPGEGRKVNAEAPAVAGADNTKKETDGEEADAERKDGGDRSDLEPTSLPEASEELKALRKLLAEFVASHMVYIESARLAVELHEHLAILRECIQKQILPSDLPPSSRLRLVVKFLELQLGSLRDALVQSGFYRQILVDSNKRQKMQREEKGRLGALGATRSENGDQGDNQPASTANHVQRVDEADASAEKGHESGGDPRES
ncbi:unnamed protein product [Neospora caninum Liverpool]|uniref:AP2 domain transcription factor AP2X-4 n=1 Tax=Neospora caninum (strain Liverpool) TaxID=572307 RepID=F0VK17_NEOCL|nr:uncharacterized protein NCLIV_048470 [Neospora caninum Liverpool]CBZ54418.1 unnamed protein product [Neospora caninum Liverpool]CEL69127.1 TPA: AP2 domain transcription factor AP2X-4 [Neospora caninum Liverpool]|eukprot:XP_003884448.1 uncharacterized protein NCLIV_048470 [Neospora caninum Liverpool]